MIGRTLGHYRVLDKIGSGGMGDVYRAEDTRLGREVALKFLPEAFWKDEERRARFSREARVLASLNHPNIAAIYGLEELDGKRVLVMELAEGETLAERLRRGLVPLDEAVAFARQIADALTEAHDKGIVHRDLKPANTMVSEDGKLKVLDFGLAKAVAGDSTDETDASQSPTLSRRMTEAGVILGTAAYMSPEQARGKRVDKRADIWAFGVVLYEMLTGRRLFSGETVSDTLAAVLRQEIDWKLLPQSTPPSVRWLLERCLERDPRERLRDIGEARNAFLRASIRAPEVATPAPPWHRVLPWAAAGTALGALAVLSFFGPWRTSPRPSPLRLSAELGADVSLFTDLGPAAILSPDGEVLAFVATKSSGGERELYIRRLDQLTASPLPGTEDAMNPFFSPDGKWIAFFASEKLKKVSLEGGAPVTLCAAPAGRGGTWVEDGTIVFQPSTGSRPGLLRVSSAGGTAEPVATLEPDDSTRRWPQVLPGSRAVLYTSHNSGTGFERANLAVQRLPRETPKLVHRGGYHGRYVASGHLVYIQEGTLYAAPFDLDRLELTGQPVPALEGVAASPITGGAQFAFSDNGTLVYVAGRSGGYGYSAPIHLMGRDGKTTPLRAKPATWFAIEFSPDGEQLAMEIHDGAQVDIWIYEWARDTLSRLTLDPADDRKPVWTPDGRRIAFARQTGNGVRNLYWQRTDGTGEAERLWESTHPQLPGSWHPGGKLLAYTENNPSTSEDIWILPVDGDESSGWKPGKPTVFLGSPFVESEPTFSPDGRWLAYESNESGRTEIYVRPFPGPGGKWQISTDGGVYPTWSRSRPELFYATDDRRIYVVPYTVEGTAFRADKP